jgi:putative ABC transport system ATP-binding protein
VIELRAVSKTFLGPADEAIQVLEHIDLVIPRGRTVAIVGPSGSGKSTLLSVIAGLECPTQGSVHVDGIDLYAMRERERAAWRARSVGFVFQAFHLLQAFSALQNVVIAAEIAGVPSPAARAREALDRVGLTSRLAHLPATLSGGERQRVAIARAIVTRPPIILADEPTGSLDARSGASVIALLEQAAREMESALVIVTHDVALAARAHARFVVEHGRIIRSDTE